MVLVRTVLLLSALFCACSTLRFSGVKRAKHTEFPRAHITGESIKEIEINASSEPGADVTLFIEEDSLLDISMKVPYFVCIYRNKTIRKCYEENAKGFELFANDILFIGTDSAQDDLISVLKRSPPSNDSSVSAGLWRKNLPEDPHTDIFFVLVKEDDTRKDNASLNLNFSEVITRRKGKSRAYKGASAECESKSCVRMVSKLQPLGNGTLYLDGDTLIGLPMERFFLCIYRGRELDRCYFEANPSLQVFPDDVLVFGRNCLRNAALHAIEEDPLLIYDLNDPSPESKLLDVGYEFFVVKVERESKKRKAEEDANADDSTGKRPPKKKQKVESSDDDSETVKRPKKRADLLSGNGSKPIKKGQGLRFEVLSVKPSGGSVEHVSNEKTLELRYNDGSAYAHAQIVFTGAETVSFSQLGGGVVIINDVNGIKNAEKLPFGDLENPIALSEFSEEITTENYKVKAGDIVLLLVPTPESSQPTPSDWTFSGIDTLSDERPQGVRARFNEICGNRENRKVSGVKAVYAVVVAQ